MIRSAEEFLDLRSSEDLDEQRRAAHEPAETKTWMAIVRDHPEMRQWVARNKTVPLEILEVLADDHNPEVRFTVASKRKLSATLFAKLSADVEPAVRAAVARNARVPDDIRARLKEDADPMVASAAHAQILH